MKKFDINYIKERNLIIYECLSGSQLYGTNTPESDVDIKGIFMLPLDIILSGKYVEQISDDKNDTTYYELGRYIELLRSSNPNILEMLYVPDEAILYKDPIMDVLFRHKDLFITKECKNSLIGYSIAQIKKARGLNKKQNWEGEKVKRKSVLDFCFTTYDQGSINIEPWLNHRHLKQEYVGLVSIPNMRYVYGMYYDFWQHVQFEKLTFDEAEYLYHVLPEEVQECTIFNREKYDLDCKSFKNLKYKGIMQSEKSNEVSLSSIERDIKPFCFLQFNKDGYSSHCKVYREYQTWLKERNEARYVTNEKHGQGIDSKNMLHCVRLLRMGVEIASGKGMIVKRPDADYLLSIRNGDVSLSEILDQCEDMIKNVDDLFNKSELPDKIDDSTLTLLLLMMRNKSYFENGMKKDFIL